MLEDPVPSLRRIEAPTLLLWGERDAMIPFTNVRRLRGQPATCDAGAAARASAMCLSRKHPGDRCSPVLKFLAQ